ncbi:MAG: polysaccharide deacetylase family protein [Azoarcus sp.]|jgi:peptidoglycan/xylan/chitin deacetylase (PgdA/CDA1 family)|nr:polysaccharide deacetylase family protein [Azoarcus sp.]
MLLRSALGLFSPAGQRARLSILIFHRILSAPDPLFPGELDVARFEARLRWIAGWFDVLPFERALTQLRDGSLPPRAAVITIDDGYAESYTRALPLLQRYGLNATFFVSSGFLAGGHMWNDCLIEAVRRTQAERLETGLVEAPAMPLRTLEEKRAFLGRLIPAVKYLSLSARREAIARIVEASGVELSGAPMLDAAQLRALRAAGMHIGSHTHNHPLLTACTDAEAEAEIAEGKSRLESAIGEPVRFFAYPNGKPGTDYARRHIDMVRRLGFEAAVTTQWGSNTRQTDPYQLARFTPWDRSRWRFGLRLMGNLMRAPVRGPL